MGGQSGKGPRTQQGRGRSREQDCAYGVGGLASRSRLPAEAHRRLTSKQSSHPGLPSDRVMAEQVGPAYGKPITKMAPVAAFNEWLPYARIPSWPGARRAPAREAGDTFAVRPAQHDSRS